MSNLLKLLTTILLILAISSLVYVELVVLRPQPPENAIVHRYYFSAEDFSYILNKQSKQVTVEHASGGNITFTYTDFEFQSLLTNWTIVNNLAIPPSVCRYIYIEYRGADQTLGLLCTNSLD